MTVTPPGRSQGRAAGLTDLQHPVVLTGLLLIAAQLGFRGWALSRSWFYTDDYLRIQEAGRASFGLDFLLQPENGHLMPGTRAVHLLFADSLGLDWGAAAAFALVFQALASLAALWMLVILFGPRWGVVPPLVLYLSSAMTAQASLWWISALNQTPVQMCFFLAVGCWVLYLRSRRLLWLLGLLATLSWGLLFFQKVLYVLPVLVVVALAYFATGGLLSRVRTLLRRYWLSGVLVGVLAGGFTAYYVAQVPSARNGPVDPEWTELTRTMIDTFVAGVAGGPWAWTDKPGGAWAEPPALFRVLGWSAVLGTVLASLLLRRRAGRAWLLLGIYYVLLVGTIAVTRASVFGAEIGATYRLQTDGLCAAVLALSFAWLPLRGAQEASEPRDRPAVWLPDRRWRVAVVGTLTVLVAASGTFSWVRYVESWSRVNDSRAFVDPLRAESDRLAGVAVVDREVPESVLDDLTRPHNKLSDIASLIAPTLRFPSYSGRLTVVTDRGTINQALIDEEAATRPGPVPGCGWSLEPGKRIRVPIEAGLSFGPRWMRVGYFLQDSGRVRIELPDRTLTAPVGSGPNSLYVEVTEGFDEVVFEGLTSRGALCVNNIEVGSPVPGPQL